MIVNILRFSFKDETADEVKAEVLAAMRRTASVESVSFSTVGQDLGDPTDGYTHAYLAGVEDLAALERYFYDPVHLDGDFLILPHLARLSAVRLSDDPDPELGAQIFAMFQRKVATYPEWAQLLDAIPDVRVSADR
ncbi:Dabb family protein [Saccharopolyspora sp. K220]|uniref:Dabb family protein n=1 Tax=Saccharopolyspora soli TaxID=2926618 RepID=UPI001F572875|nr:Dabb family protein [Saccharopolyspora soli]MCI2419779.1 Dabb family protein [Saccharopolyspora soli]